MPRPSLRRPSGSSRPPAACRGSPPCDRPDRPPHVPLGPAGGRAPDRGVAAGRAVRLQPQQLDRDLSERGRRGSDRHRARRRRAAGPGRGVRPLRGPALGRNAAAARRGERRAGAVHDQGPRAHRPPARLPARVPPRGGAGGTLPAQLERQRRRAGGRDRSARRPWGTSNAAGRRRVPGASTCGASSPAWSCRARRPPPTSCWYAWAMPR